MRPDPTFPPLFDQNAVRHVLEQMRQAEPFGDTPLRRLVWVRQQIDAQGAQSSRTGMELALATTLTTLITNKLAYHRHIEKLAGEADETRESSLAALQRDFSRNNVALEAWSLLYYRYVRVDLSLQVQDIVQALDAYPKLINRRLTFGYHRLTEALSKLEAEARTTNKRLWLKLKLPPPNYATLFGVDELLARLQALLKTHAPPHIIALIGPGGIGKTTLAHAAASHIIDTDQLDDFAWLTLDAPTSYSMLLGKLVHALGYLHLTSATHAEREANLRERFATAHMLIVIDNAEMLEAHEIALPRLDALLAPGHLLITDRVQPAPHIAVYCVPVPPLNLSASLALLLDYAEKRRIHQVMAMDQATLRSIIDAVGGNPLATRMVVSHLAFLPLARIFEHLPSLNTPEGEPLFDYLYSQSWAALSRPAQQTLLALSLAPPEGIEWDALQAITTLDPLALDAALVDLINASLVDATDMPPRYSIHSLTRRFATQQAALPIWDAVYRAILHRALVRALQIVPFEGALQADAAYAIMLLSRQIDLAESAEQIGAAVMRIYPAARRSGQWGMWQRILHYVIEQPLRTPQNRPIIARAMIELGIAHRWLAEYEAALHTFQEAITLLGEYGEFAEQGEALLEKGQLFEMLGQTSQAYESYQRATAVAERLRLPVIRRRALIGLSGLALHNDDYLQALSLLEDALTTLEDGEVDGVLFSQLGVVLMRHGRIDEGITAHLQALEVLQENGDLPRLARAHLRIGTAYHAAGQLDQAHQHLQSGLDLMRSLGDSFAQARLMTNLGTLYAKQDLWRDALAAWRDALALQANLKDEAGMAVTLYNIGDLEWRLGRVEEALSFIMEAYHTAQRLNITALLERIITHPINVTTTT